MSMKKFIEKSKEEININIIDSYRNIDMLYYEIDLLYYQLQRYSNKTVGQTLSHRERLREMNNIRKKIPLVYDDINYYKKCINVTKKEMIRIVDTYSCEEDLDELDELDEFDELYDINNLEEIKDYKYNFITDRWVCDI